MRAILLVAAMVGGLAPLSTARAAECGSVSGDSGANVIILGEAYVWNDALENWWPVNPTYGLLVACRQNSNGTWSFVTTSCTGANTSADWVTVAAGAGDDVVTVHPGGIFTCGSSYPYAVGPWWSGWNGDFHIRAQMGDGADVFHGSPNNDQAWSNNTSLTADGDIDHLCGYGGNDTLRGDNTDSYSSDMECLAGGDGTDTCDGGTNSMSDPDALWSCETASNGTTSLWWGSFPSSYRCDLVVCGGPEDLSP